MFGWFHWPCDALLKESGFYFDLSCRRKCFHTAFPKRLVAKIRRWNSFTFGIGSNNGGLIRGRSVCVLHVKRLGTHSSQRGELYLQTISHKLWGRFRCTAKEKKNLDDLCVYIRTVRVQLKNKMPLYPFVVRLVVIFTTAASDGALRFHYIFLTLKSYSSSTNNWGESNDVMFIALHAIASVPYRHPHEWLQSRSQHVTFSLTSVATFRFQEGRATGRRAERRRTHDPVLIFKTFRSCATTGPQQNVYKTKTGASPYLLPRVIVGYEALHANIFILAANSGIRPQTKVRNIQFKWWPLLL